ncbi:Type I secretion outer membrane protein, TolC family [Oceaniovalibus guishaninsula JLT2003]|uniref:Type I secretion outer membrane protein, TolC family n=1 Tax=Oceaniovalibus guishaninsula JLT2003 TaxID=1231392 RepID=K2HBL9_9RHOB|nr:TolC family outer membrane protein [Oceaniovalibus guishaninsula]EKE44012.1 Type I secretion outer membrane protein, TolC family [Oceaniovalibus guishaninsula JLT2003]
MAALMLVAAPLGASAESLSDALIMAYRNSGLLENNRATLRAADEDVAQAVAALRPVITYTAQMARQYAFPNDRTTGETSIGGLTIAGRRITDTEETVASMSLAADLLLWDGGAARLAIDSAKELVLVARQGLIAVEQIVLLNAVDAFVSVREAEALVNLRQNNVRLIDQQLQAAQDRFEVGEVTRTDVALAESRLASGRSDLAAALGNLEIARAEYREQIGQLPGNLTPPGNLPQTAPSLDAAQAVAVRTHPDIQRDQRLVTVAELSIARAKAQMKPRISAQARVAIDENYEENASVGIVMTGPIYRGGQLTSLYRQAIAQRDANRGDLYETINDIERQVATAWARLEVARARISATDLEIRAATVAFEGLQEEAQLGARTTLDVLDAEQDLLNARVDAIQARTTEVLAVYAVLAAMGLLTVDHLNLGIVTYDPSAYYDAVSDAPIHRISPQGAKLDALLRSLGRE